MRLLHGVNFDTKSATVSVSRQRLYSMSMNFRTVHHWCSFDRRGKLAAEQRMDSNDEDTDEEWPATMNCFSSCLFNAVISDVSQSPVVVAVLRHTAVLAETSGDIRREVAAAAG